MMQEGLIVHNGEASDISDLPCCSLDDFRNHVLGSIDLGRRVISFFAHRGADSRTRLISAIGDDSAGHIILTSAMVDGEFPSFTTDAPQLHLFEREIFETYGIIPRGHPWLKPVRFQNSELPACGDFFRVKGDEIHEVSVGPVHAGVIEPGHFRFQCHGEEVLHLEIALGFGHRGIERAMIGGPARSTISKIETIAGDTTIGHAIAYCQICDSLSSIHASARAQSIRAIALELERIANHVGDLGALAGDIGYLPTSSFCGRLRGDILNLTAFICGSRFGRGLVRPGGVLHDIDDERAAELSVRLGKAMEDIESAVSLLWDSPSVLSRFDDTGQLTREQCEELGVVGPAARASGIERDIRQDYTCGIYRFFHVPVSSWGTGDVFARAFVRWLEITRSVSFIDELTKALTPGAIAPQQKPLAGDKIVVSLVEGWRGEIAHMAITDDEGKFARYKIVDPSFHNWMGLALAMRDGEISDFPLCNKSFNLSYCGHDL